MDWRSLSRVSSPSWLGSIMALIVESDSNRPEERRVRRAGLRTPARVRLWPTGNRDGCLRWLLTVAILLVTCLAQPIGCSRGELHVHEYAILRTDPCAGNVQPPPSFGGGKSALKLSELVTQSDVIFKAFAGYGNDLRAVALGNGTQGMPVAEASQHRPHQHQQQQQQQYHHQPRWKPQARTEHGGAKATGADFIVRLEPATVYKGNELFKQLQLNSWQHYFILWSNGSVEYTHRDVPPIQGSAGSESSVPNTTKREPDTSSPATVAFTRRSAASSIGPTPYANCTNRQPLTHQRLPIRTQAPAVAEAAQPIDTDEPIDRITITTTTPYIARASTDDDDDQKPLSAGERVNLHTGDSPSQQADERETAQPGPPATMGQDFQREGQISRTLSEILPVTLVVFGRLVGGGGGGGGRTDKLLRVDPYVGLLRWDERLEDALWQTLGWSAWSDYTSCSVACGGGVQQRFRHCLPSAPADRAEPNAPTDELVPPTVTPSFSNTRSNVFNSEIENPITTTTTTTATERTQPVAYGAPPSVSITARQGGNKWSRKLQSKQPAEGAKVQQQQARPFHTEPVVNEKRIMNPTVDDDGEPISSESIPIRWLGGKFNPSATRRLRGTGAAAPVEPAHQNRPRASQAEGTWSACEGHNIEQRSCNTFECTGTIDLLAAVTPTTHWRTAWDESVEDRINYAINQLDQNFTLMMSLRLKPVSDDNGRQQSGQTATVRPTGGHIFSIRSKLTAGSSLSINFETDGHGGLRVLQEKYGLSEMLPVRSGALTLRDGAWHSLALSGRYGGFVTVYIDCQWINSFVLTKGSIELPQYPTVEVGHSVELRQLTVVPGEKSARLQCNPRPVPIHDVENRRVTNYFEHLN